MMNNNTLDNNFWGTYAFTEGQSRYWQIGDLGLWIQSRQKEWSFAYQYEVPGENRSIVAGEDRPMPDKERNTYVVGEAERIVIVPALPDKPVVLKPESNYNVLSNRKIDVFITIPLCLQIYNGQVGEDNLMLDIPVMKLSRTWFGDPDNGELAYSLYSLFYQQLTDVPVAPHIALCPLHIHNDSAAVLDIQRLCVRVRHLELYSTSNYLATNEVKVEFKGVDQSSNITFSSKQPELQTSFKRISPARIPNTKSLIKKSFYFIKALSHG